MYTERFYRDWISQDGSDRFEVTIGESDLLIRCDHDLYDVAFETLAEVRRGIEDHIASDPRFAVTLEPCAIAPGAAPIIREMASAAHSRSIGPMAAVAGAVAEAVAVRLLRETTSVSVENGGDVFIRAPGPVIFLLYAGEDSPFSDSIAFEVDATEGIGVCTSSAVVGPSLSFGRADAVVAIAGKAAVADAAATAIANRISTPGDIGPVIEAEQDRGSLKGLLACCGDRLGVWGDVALVDRYVPERKTGMTLKQHLSQLIEEGTIS